VAARVSTYMTSDVITIDPMDTLAHARKLMLSKNVNRLVVVEGDRPVGMLTVTDMVNALLTKFIGVPLDSIYVNQVMSRDLKTVRSTQTIRTAAQIMFKYKIGGLPVVSADDRLVGIITRTDIVRAYAERGSGRFMVGQVMRREVATAKPEHHLFYILNKLQGDPAGKVVIVDDNNRPIGIIAKRDLAFVTLPPRATLKRKRMKKRKVYDPDRDKIIQSRIHTIAVAADIMSRDVKTASPNDDLADAAGIMYENDVGALPVVDNEGSLIGIVSKIEIVEVVAKFF